MPKRRMHMKIKFFKLALCIVASVFVIFGSSWSASGQVKKATAVKETKTERMLKDAGASYSPFQGEHSFIVSYAGKEKKEIDVIIIEADSMVITLVDVAAAREVQLTSEIMRKLLEFNTGADYIKVGISELGSIRVQSEQNLTLINSKSFKEILDQTAAGGDDVAKILKSVFKAGEKPAK